MNAVVIDAPEDWRLTTLSNDITEAVFKAEAHAKHAVQAAARAGRLLSEAKELVPHGQWESWLSQNVNGLATRTAQAYMRLSKKLAGLPHQEAQRVADLPLRQALAAIATPPATAPSRVPSVLRVERKTERERLHEGFTKSADSLRRVARHIAVNHVRRTDYLKARTALQSALDLLDELRGDQQRGEVVEVEVEALEGQQ